MPVDGHVPPVPLSPAEVESRREHNPLAAVWPDIQSGLSGTTIGLRHLLFLSDSTGHLLWIKGDASTMRAAERVHLVPGALWSERAAGTSGVGMALALERPFQVFGSEHFLSIATPYTCTAAPIRDPVTGEVLGAVDLTSAMQNVGPMALSLLRTVARLAEAQLLAHHLQRTARIQEKFAHRLSHRLGAHAALVDSDGIVVHESPVGWLPARISPIDEHTGHLDDGRPVTVERLAAGGPFLVVANGAAEDIGCFQGLGRHRARLTLAGATHELSRRHSEIAAILLAHPSGRSAQELTRAVYGAHGKETTLRAELARLRAILGQRLLAEPYRLSGEFRIDFLDLERDVRGADVGALLDQYPAPLLPRSTAPGVQEIRARLHGRIRRRVLAAGDPDATARWASIADL